MQTIDLSVLPDPAATSKQITCLELVRLDASGRDCVVCMPAALAE